MQGRFRAGEDDVPPVAVLPTVAVTLGPSLILLAGQNLGWVSAASGVCARCSCSMAVGQAPGSPLSAGVSLQASAALT